MTQTTIYLIDGVQVSQKIYERRQIWGEHAEAIFRTVTEKKYVTKGN